MNKPLLLFCFPVLLLSARLAVAQQESPAATASPSDASGAGLAAGADASTTGESAKKGSWVGRALRTLITDTTAEGKRSFRAYPTIGFSPETSFEFGFSGLLLYNAKGDTQNRISEVNAFTFVTLEGQYGFWLDHALYGDKDRWFFLGRLRAQRFPLLYWGIGPETPDRDRAIIDASYLLLRERVLHKVIPNLFIGPEADFQWLVNPEFMQPEEGGTLDLPLGFDGTRNLGFGGGIVYDDRHNVLNVREGHFAEVSYLDYRDAWGSEYNFNSITLDARAYRSLNERNVLAGQVFGNFLQGQNDQVPFNHLAQIGGDMIMRGYYAGRYRDRKVIAAQLEHRWLPFKFSKRLGGTVFAAAGAVSPHFRDFSVGDIRPAGGVGVRYYLFPKKDIFLRLDVGVTPGGIGFYIYTGEAF